MIGDDALWLPPRIWAYCAENQPDGDLSTYAPVELAMLIGYNKDATSMLEALKACGFVTSDGHIHDWDEHNGYHQKYSERAKTAADARWKKAPPRTPLKEEKESGKRKVDSGDKHCLEHACSIYEAYPKKVARSKALQSIVKAIDLDGFELVLKATQEFASAWSGASLRRKWATAPTQQRGSTSSVTRIDRQHGGKSMETPINGRPARISANGVVPDHSKRLLKP